MNLKAYNKIILILLAASMVVGVLPAQAEESAIVSLKQTGRAFASIAKLVSPAVVNIQSDQTLVPGEGGDEFGDEGLSEEYIPAPFSDLFKSIDPRMQPYQGRRPSVVRQGSGFIISKDGYILTNNHLIQNATKVTVKLLDNKEYIAKVVGADPQTDIAVLKIKASNLPIVELGNSDDLEVGEWVVALGNPFGLSHSLSAGILSAKGRSSVGISDYENFLQTDAAINPGNSGGPLLDLEGKVIGINTAIFSRSGGYMGIGFAIPINMAKSISDQLIATGNVIRGYLGVKIQDLTKDLAEQFGLKDRKGILVAQLEKDSPAEKSGMKQGDVILSLNNKNVESIGDFRNEIAASKPGSTHSVSIIRDKKPLQLSVTVGKLPTEAAPAKESKSTDEQIIGRVGISVQNLSADVATKLGVKQNSGVVVSKVKPGSIAEFAGVMRGTVISEVNRVKVTNVKQFSDEIAKAAKSKSVLLLIQDQYGSRYVVINVG